MNRQVNNISGRLSLRTPQRRSLEILDHIMNLARPHSNSDVDEMLAAIRTEFNTVEEFERDFPNICFALATGVGKTRLMGAFIAYLHLEHGIRHFFVLSPNLTIYNKLITDFTPNTAKYVFQGISEFAVKAPVLVTGDNFTQKPQTLDLFERDDVVVNVFNIAKFNTRSKDSRKAWALSEFLGQSYFDHLSELDDLVLIMDEAHRYRASTSLQSIEDLKPVLGLELTATPQIESGSTVRRFKNIIYDYPLSAAMRDGYVKEPAVATRADFNPSTMSAAALERLKLEDGIRIHESVKVDLDVYAQQNGVKKVKPFMLVVASDTQHASDLVELIEDDAFFDGRYRGRVIEVHSGQKGAEKDDNVERLLAVENPDEPTEIVVHVNMLKEGWDVTNLYTIVPLRAANSRTLVEQSIGRGLRLPYGRRTGVPAVDRLTIVAHDRFQDIVDEAKKGGYSFSVITIGEDVPEKPKQSITVAPVVDSILGGQVPIEAGKPGYANELGSGDRKNELAENPEPIFKSPEELNAAKHALEAIRKATRDTKLVAGPVALQSKKVQDEIVKAVTETLSSGQLDLYSTMGQVAMTNVVDKVTAIFIAHTIAIPRVIVLPTGDVKAGFHEFTLDTSSLNLQPVSEEILIQHLVGDTREVIGVLEGGHEESRLEDYVVRGLIDFDDISYDEQADFLYSLAEQVVCHLKGYLKDGEKVRNVLLFHQRKISDFIHAQMRNHSWEEATEYEAVVSQGFSEVRPQAFVAPADEVVRMFDIPVANKTEIRKMLFGGFKKCLYPTQKFDVDTERRFAIILENDGEVKKWFKPGKGVFKIRYSGDSDYEPDFVVETENAKYLCEPKRADQIQEQSVLAKARAAATWCQHATDHELLNDGKPWRYLLIPHDTIADNMTFGGLVQSHAFDITADNVQSN